MEKISNAQALQFHLDNGLSEIISDTGQNRFLLKEITKKTVVKAQVKAPLNQYSVAQNKPSTFTPKQVSTKAEALPNIAKKPQIITQNKSVQPAKFTPLNDILARAAKAAKAASNLLELRKAVEDFDGCNLKKMATNTIFCDGNPDSKVMVIGEAPGNDEDLQGIPFCGDSGKVLDAMFAAINMTRAENFYLTNVIFWRPPGNRRPTDEELAICRPFVERHIELMNPEILVLVGATAMTAILGIKDPITKVRGKIADFTPEFLSKGIKSLTIFHPSYLTRQNMKKKVAWMDMLCLEQFLN